MLAIKADVIERRAILRPYDRAGGPRDDVRQFGHAIEVAYPDGEQLGAGLVSAPRQQPVIGRMRGRAEPEECLADRQRVAVDQDLANSAAARLATNRWMLATVAIASEVGERAVGRRNARIFLFDATSHFCDQGFLQRHRGGEHRIRKDVLPLEMIADYRVE